MSSIHEAVTSLFEGDGAWSKLGDVIGGDSDNAQKAVEVAAPALVAALAARAAADDGESVVVGLVDDADSSIVDRLGENLEEPDNELTQSVFDGVFGDDGTSLASHLAEDSDIESSVFTKLWPQLTPVLMGVIAARREAGELNATETVELLTADAPSENDSDSNLAKVAGLVVAAGVAVLDKADDAVDSTVDTLEDGIDKVGDMIKEAFGTVTDKADKVEAKVAKSTKSDEDTETIEVDSKTAEDSSDDSNDGEAVDDDTKPVAVVEAKAEKASKTSDGKAKSGKAESGKVKAKSGKAKANSGKAKSRKAKDDPVKAEKESKKGKAAVGVAAAAGVATIAAKAKKSQKVLGGGGGGGSESASTGGGGGGGGDDEKRNSFFWPAVIFAGVVVAGMILFGIFGESGPEPGFGSDPAGPEADAEAAADADTDADADADADAAADAEDEADEDADAEAVADVDEDADAEDKADADADAAEDDANADVDEDADAEDKADAEEEAPAEDEEATDDDAASEGEPETLNEKLGLEPIIFPYLSEDLTLPVSTELDKVIAFMEENSDVIVEIQGHTDSDGSEEDNQKLSEIRAEAVANYFIGKGVEEDRVTTRGFGETRPAVPNDSLEAKAQNRRIVIIEI